MPDSCDRKVGYAPPKGLYNPRWLLDGKTNERTASFWILRQRLLPGGLGGKRDRFGNGELRGGVWVILDPSINSAKPEMHADVDVLDLGYRRNQDAPRQDIALDGMPQMARIATRMSELRHRKHWQRGNLFCNQSTSKSRCSILTFLSTY